MNFPRAFTFPTVKSINCYIVWFYLSRAHPSLFMYLLFTELFAFCADIWDCFLLQDDIRREAQTMSLINHPNVITAHCSFVVDRNLWVVMPFMDEGSCLHLMKIAYPDGFEESAIASFLKETLKALVYLHHHGHIHRDVKVLESDINDGRILVYLIILTHFLC